jgi:hypothetical protein
MQHQPKPDIQLQGLLAVAKLNTPKTRLHIRQRTI